MPEGAVEWPFLLWICSIIASAVAGAITVVVTGARLFAARDKATADLKEQTGKALAKLEADHRQAVDKVSSDLAAYKAHVGETFATKQSVTIQLQRIEETMKAFGDRVESSVQRLTERIDRILEARAGDQPPRGGRST